MASSTNKEKKGTPEIISTLFFVRHAESRCNAGIANEYNSRLSEEGKRQASKLSGDVELVIVSSLYRTLETLLNSKINYKKLLICEWCREVRSDSIARWKGDLPSKGRDNILCNFRKGEEIKPESRKELQDRANKFKVFLDSLIPNYKSILILSHGGFIQTFLNLEHNLKNTEVIRVEVMRNEKKKNKPLLKL